MSNYSDKLRKVFETADAQYTYLSKHPTPHDLSLRKDIPGSGRDYANMIHDMPNEWTGRASETAIANKLADSKFKHSCDHFHSRQRGGEEIVRYVLRCHELNKRPTRKHIKKLIDKYCQVHYVTKKENQRLKHTMKPGMSWEEAYDICGVKLLDAHDLFGRRGRHSEEWKQEMNEKYQPLISGKRKGRRRK